MQTEDIVSTENQTPPFEDEKDAFKWFWRQDPLGVKSVNLVELSNKPESRMQKCKHDALDVYSAILRAIKGIESWIDQESYSTRKVFRLYFVGIIDQNRRTTYGADEIAELIGIHRSKVYPKISQLYDDFYYEFLKRGLVRKRDKKE